MVRASSLLLRKRNGTVILALRAEHRSATRSGQGGSGGCTHSLKAGRQLARKNGFCRRLVGGRRTFRSMRLTPGRPFPIWAAIAAHGADCNTCIYTSSEPDQGAVEAFRLHWLRRSPPRTTTDPERWSPELITPRPDAFSFVRPVDFADPGPPGAGPVEPNC